MMNVIRLWIIVIFTLQIACTHSPKQMTYDAQMLNCHHQLNSFKSQLKKQDTLDAQSDFIEGFPFLAVDRFLAQLYLQARNRKQKQEWLTHSYELSQFKYSVSFRNSEKSQNIYIRQTYCSEMLYRHLWHDPDQLWSQLDANQLQPKDNYSTSARFFGIYWLTQWIAKPSFDRWRQKTFSSWENTRESMEFYTWRSHSVTDKLPDQLRNEWFQRAYERSALRLPQLEPEQLDYFIKHHAPVWKVEQLNESKINLPGTPKFNGSWKIDTSQATVYQHRSYTFFKGRKLLQLNYLVWFPASRYEANNIDWYGGLFDGIYWRVTLDTDGEVLLYDSIHACGCYHTVIPNPERLSWAPKSVKDPPFLSPAPWVIGPISLTLSAEKHWLIGIGKQEKEVDYTYDLLPDTQLRSVEFNQEFMSFYDSQGYVRGSERAERYYIWPFGIENAGAMRQWGQHATAFIGRRHFDDAHWMDQIFEPTVKK